jgi:hypothetical protein
VSVVPESTMVPLGLGLGLGLESTMVPWEWGVGGFGLATVPSWRALLDC